MTAFSPTSLLSTPRIALLIDGENLSPTCASSILIEARKFGDPAIRRVYGKSEHIAGWDQEGFRLVPTRPGKNAADLLLTVEAMSLALKDGVTTLVIATSDGDFVYLATHLRELSCTVIGIGHSKAPNSFRASCHRFVTLQPPQVALPVEQPAKTVKPKQPANKIIPIIRAILPDSTVPDNWAYFPWLQRKLLERDPDFDPKDYGHDNLESLVLAVKFFDVEGPDEKRRIRDPHRKSVLPALS
jgi:hypothetical protein